MSCSADYRTWTASKMLNAVKSERDKVNALDCDFVTRVTSISTNNIKIQGKVDGDTSCRQSSQFKRAQLSLLSAC